MTDNKIPEGYKQSPLGIIPEDWDIYSVGQVFEHINTASFSRENLISGNTESNINYIHYGDIHSTFRSEILDLDNEDLPLLKDEFGKGNFHYLNEGDLVVADASEDYEGIGECIELRNVRNRKVIGGLHTLVLRDKAGLTANGFRVYALRNADTHKALKRIATGISVYGISKSNLTNIKILLPSIQEQQAIANSLMLMDDLIENIDQLIAQKELRKKWLMQQLLTGKKRLRGGEDNWSVYDLHEIFERITRKNKDGCDNVVTISAQRGFIRQNEFFNKKVASEVVDNYFLVKQGEFCYNKSYSNGYDWGAIKRLKNFDEAVVTTLYICFAIKNTSKTSGDFFEHFFEAALLDRGLMKIAHEGGRAHGLLNVTPGDFFNLKITIPEIEEQIAIAEVLQTTDKEIQLLKAKAEKLKEQKKGMMQQLLTGKKRLKIKEETKV